MVIRIKRGRVIVAVVPSDAREPSDESKLQMIAWLVSDVSRKLGVEEFELVFDPDARPDAVGVNDR